jgi:hypothetical protein
MNVTFVDKAPEKATSDVVDLHVVHGPHNSYRTLIVCDEGYGICFCDLSWIAVAQKEDHRYPNKTHRS